MLECPDIWLVSYIALQNKFCENVKELDIYCLHRFKNLDLSQLQALL